MLRTIITTCGTSLFKSCCWEYDELIDDTYWADNVKERDKKRPIIERKCYDILKGDFDDNKLKNGRDLASRFKSTIWMDEEDTDEDMEEKAKYLRDMPAELASLSAIQLCLANKKKSKRSLGFGDEVILLHSSNDEGLFCADVICETLSQKKLLSEGVKIKKCQVNGLDPSDATKFGSALDEIWYNIVPKYTKNKGEYIFNLTGGYKGVSILLGAFAYKTPNAKIFYLYEDSDNKNIAIMFFDPLSGRGVNQLKNGYFDLTEKKLYIPSHPSPD